MSNSGNVSRRSLRSDRNGWRLQMTSAKTSALPSQQERLQWHMPISPVDYPDRDPVLSEEERKGIEHLLSLSSWRSEEHTSELQSHLNLVCRLLLEKKKALPLHSQVLPDLRSSTRSTT